MSLLPRLLMLLRLLWLDVPYDFSGVAERLGQFGGKEVLRVLIAGDAGVVCVKPAVSVCT
jgi:hypothetical protein